MMLRERGVTSADELVAALRDDQMDGALGTILWWDDSPHEGPRAVSPGLLVAKIREGGMPGYRRPHERTTPEGVMGVSEELLSNIRRVALSPGGVTREMMRDVLEVKARALQTPPDALIDSAVGPGWKETPAHPAKQWSPNDELAPLRYSWVCVHGWGRPEPRTQREPLEAEWDFGHRFWGWTDPPELREAAEAMRREAAEEAKREREAAAAVQRAQAEIQEVPDSSKDLELAGHVGGQSLGDNPANPHEERDRAAASADTSEDEPW
jgi:hypothetical protein